MLGVIGLALVRNLIREITRLVSRGMAGAAAKAANSSQHQGSSQAGRPRKPGKLERDPQTGTYVDPSQALKASVAGTTYYFESQASLDAFKRRQTRKA